MFLILKCCLLFSFCGFCFGNSDISSLVAPNCDILVEDPSVDCYSAQDCDSYRECLGLFVA